MEKEILKAKVECVKCAEKIYQDYVGQIKSHIKDLNEYNEDAYWYEGSVCLNNVVDTLEEKLEQLRRLEKLAQGSYKVFKILQGDLREELFLENELVLVGLERMGIENTRALDLLMEGYTIEEVLKVMKV